MASLRVALIVGGARSGSTLLRLLLDAHPEIGAAAEAGIPSLMAHVASVWSILEGGERAADDRSGARAGQDPTGAPAMSMRGAAGLEPKARLSEAARRAVASTAIAAMESYCGREKKGVYCDKSLDSVYRLELVQEIFPDARCILLFRHVMDAVASGIEASPWGFQAYGYAPFVQAWPGNFVAALVNYWLSHVEPALAWETEHPAHCHRVRYEDLVTEPEATLTGIFRFLGVAEDMRVLDRVFDRARMANGPGDYKIAHTSEIHARSVGRGKRVPVAMIPAPLLEAMNVKLEALGYEAVGQAWNAQPRPVFHGWGTRLQVIMDELDVASSRNGRTGSFALVAEDYHELRWVIDPESGEVRRGDGEVESVIIGTAEDLVRMISGEVNLGVLLRSGRIRHVTGDEEHAPRELLIEIEAIRALLASAHRSADATGRDAG
jgi:protein-tyrosine sulfotransferase